MDINIVYSGHSGPPSEHHKSELGIVQIWNQRDPKKFNVFTQIVEPQGSDCFFMQEPIVVRPQDFIPDNVKKFHKVFTWYEGFNLPNIVKIDFPSILNDPNLDNLKSNPSWDERNDEIVIIANPKRSSHGASIYSLREKLADELYQRGFKISWYGQQKMHKPYFIGTVGDKYNVLKKTRFSICSENTYDPLYSKNYLTEKLPHVLISGCVPLYIGCHNIEDFGMNNKTMIDLRKYVKVPPNTQFQIDALAEYIRNFNQFDYNTYREEMYGEIQKPDGLFHRVSYHTAYETMLRTLNQ